ncbi:hypothetical protein Q7P35_009669 [Cladosporium inversicolor]
MASDTKTIKAACLCGDAAHNITLPSNAFPITTYFCTCNSCRHMTGTLFLSTAFLPPSYQPSSSLLDKLTSFKFSDRITQYFCKRCGSTMLCYCIPKPSNTHRVASWDVMTGTLEAFDSILDFKGYEYIHDTRDGGFSHFMPVLNNRLLDCWSYDINTSPQLPLYWQDPSTSKESVNPTTRLPAHCKCNSITFYIARPSAQSTKATRSWPDLLVPYHSSQEQGADKDDKDPLSTTAGEPWHLRASSTKFLAGLCSCTSCRLASGQELTAWAFIPLADISLDAEGKIPLELSSVTTGTSTSKSTSESAFASNLQTYNSSEDVTRSFCSVCGAIVFFHVSSQHSEERDRRETTLLDVAVGLLDAPEGARAENWLEWHTERLSFREDAVGRADSLADGVEKGLREFKRSEEDRK